MLSPAGGTLHIAGFEMEYIRFGTGKTPLILIPGLGDAFKSVKGLALPFSVQYKTWTHDFTVYSFSRRTQLPPQMSTREMAEDLHLAMRELGLAQACVLGVSQGGMIVQHLAIDHPADVDKLILTVTLSRPNETVKAVVSHWMELARQGDYKGILVNTAALSYSEKKVKAAIAASGLIGSMGKAKNLDRFLIQAEACLAHDCYDELPRIACPTLVIGGGQDRIVTGEASQEIADQISGSELIMYPGLGHALYEEAPDFQKRILEFCV